MSRPDPDADTRPPSPALRTVAAFAGALGGLALYVVVWLAANPPHGVRAALDHAANANWSQDPVPLFLILGAIAGLLLARAPPGRAGPAVQRFLRGAAWSGLGLSVGAAAGTTLYLVFWTVANPQAGLAEAITRLPNAVRTPRDPLAAFVIAGAMSGLSVAVYTVGAETLKNVARRVSGGILGGTAGLVTYCIAYVVTNYPRVNHTGEYVFRTAEAIYSFTPVEFFLVGLGAAIGAAMARYSWRTYGVYTLVALVSTVLGFLLYSLAVTLPNVPPGGHRVLSYLIFIAETFSLGMVILYSFYTLDVATRKHWRRNPEGAKFSKYYAPRVAFQVPCFNEPPDLVKDTLRALMNVDYPRDRVVIMVLDDSTDPASADPLRAFCEEHGLMYIHRAERGGFKAGALNNAIPHTPDEVEYIAVIDADYQVEANFLAETVGYFIDPNIGWIQTPQDYRNGDQSFLTQQYALADAYFYRTVLPSRNEENSIIFCGTMGILRKSALLEAGGWGEKYITEDAELSVRLINLGYDSFYINKTYGRGLIPATFEGYKKQHYRWAFGGAKILKGHFFDILFKRFTARQKLDYFVGSFHWFEGAFVVFIALAVLMLGLGDLLGFDVVTHHSQEILLIGLVPFFILLDGMTRLHMVLRRTVGPSISSTLRILGMWFSVKFSNTFAALKAVFGANIPFVRTPKAPEGRIGRGEALTRALALTRFETFMSASMLIVGSLVAVKTYLLTDVTGVAAVARGFLVFWLTWYGLVFAAAPVYAYKSYVTFRPQPEPAPAAARPVGTPQ